MTLYEALNEINKLQENVAGVEDVNGLLNEEVKRLKSENSRLLEEKAKLIEENKNLIQAISDIRQRT